MPALDDDREEALAQFKVGDVFTIGSDPTQMVVTDLTPHGFHAQWTEGEMKRLRGYPPARMNVLGEMRRQDSDVPQES